MTQIFFPNLVASTYVFLPYIILAFLCTKGSSYWLLMMSASGCLLCLVITPLVFSRCVSPIHFKLGKYLTNHKYFQNKSKWYPRSRDVLMTSSYFVKFSETVMKFQFEITFDLKNYFLLLLQFVKENLLEISDK